MRIWTSLRIGPLSKIESTDGSGFHKFLLIFLQNYWNVSWAVSLLLCQIWDIKTHHIQVSFRNNIFSDKNIQKSFVNMVIRTVKNSMFCWENVASCTYVPVHRWIENWTDFFLSKQCVCAKSSSSRAGEIKSIDGHTVRNYFMQKLDGFFFFCRSNVFMQNKSSSSRARELSSESCKIHRWTHSQNLFHAWKILCGNDVM